MAYNQRRLLQEFDALVAGASRIRLYEIALALGVDRHTIEKAMRSVRGMSFRDYKRRELLYRAHALLDKPTVSVKKAGESLGYSHGSSFSRFVHKSTGKTPSQLRKGL
jgi:methylphosphotriester-DNA--protein-cysteine methyltransferase